MKANNNLPEANVDKASEILPEANEDKTSEVLPEANMNKSAGKLPEGNSKKDTEIMPEANISTDIDLHTEEIAKKKTKKKHKLPRPVKIGIICGIIGVIVFFIVYALIQVRSQHSKAYVQSVSDMNMGYFGSSTTYSGTITDEDAQTIPVDSTKTVSEVYVKAGDTVKKGTPLLKYDENEARIQLETDEESLSDSKEKLAMEQKLLDYYNALTPIADPLSKTEQKKQDEIDKKADEQYEKDLAKNYPELMVTEIPDNTVYTTALDTGSINLQAGASFQVNIKSASSESSVEDSNSSTWHTDEKSVATVDGGLIKANTSGTVTISAEGLSDTVNVNVTSSAPSLCAVKLDKYRVDLRGGETKKITPTAYKGADGITPNQNNAGNGGKAGDGNNVDNATYKNGLGSALTSGVSFTFSSSDDTVAKVSSDGTVTGGNEGTAIITATASLSNDNSVKPVTGIATVVVSNGSYYPSLESVALSESAVNLDLTDVRKMSKHIGAKVTPSDAKIDKIEWKSSDEKVATVSDGYITGLKEGTATITLTVNDKTASCIVTVVGEAKGEILTVSEKAEKIKEINSNIKSINQDIKSSEATIKTDKQAISDLTVDSLVDGIVKVASDPLNPPNDGTPFLSIGSANGVSVSFYVDEYSYPNIKKGDKFNVTNYMNGQMAEASVTAVSDYPSEDYNSYGNQNTSYYKVTAFLENGDGFNVDDSVDVAPVSDDTENSNAIIIEKVYVRRDSKGSYVMIDDGTGHLKRQEVTTKKSSDSESVEITSGLTNEDLIAFPYGDRAKEGTLTTTDYPTNLFGM